MLRKRLLGPLLVCAASAPAATAQADDGEAILGATVVTSLVVSDVVFTVYSAITVDANEEPDTGWMIAQTSVVGLQALVLNGLGAGVAAFFPLATLLGTLSTFGAWSLIGSGTSIDVKARFGLSSVLAMNTYFSGVAIATMADGRPLPDYMSIPQTALMAPEFLLTTIKAVTDPEGRAEWIGLASWSGLLTLHGTTSLILRGIAFEKAQSASAFLPFATTTEGPIPGLTFVGAL
jgi:hypothetical protein